MHLTWVIREISLCMAAHLTLLWVTVDLRSTVYDTYMSQMLQWIMTYLDSSSTWDMSYSEWVNPVWATAYVQLLIQSLIRWSLTWIAANLPCVTGMRNLGQYEGLRVEHLYPVWRIPLYLESEPLPCVTDTMEPWCEGILHQEPMNLLICYPDLYSTIEILLRTSEILLGSDRILSWVLW